MPLRPIQRAWLSAGVLTVAIGGIIAAIWFSPLHSLLTEPEEFQRIIKHAGWWAPVIIVALQIAQVVVAPIPGQAIDIANGYIFGWFGIVVSLIGLGLGSTLAIALAKRYGRPLVEILVTPKGLSSMRHQIRRRSQWLFFVLFLLPGTPDDLLCFGIGLTSIPFGRCVMIALLGRMPGVAAAVAIGATGQHVSLLNFSLIAAGVSLALGLVLWKWPGAPLQQLMEPKKN